jgi:hypothetical protein
LFNLVADIFKQWIKGFKVSDPATKQRCKCHLEKRKKDAQVFLMKLLIEPYFKKGSKNSKEEKAYIYMVKAYIYIDWQLLKQCCYKSKSPPFPRNDVLLHFAACWIKMCLFKG